MREAIFGKNENFPLLYYASVVEFIGIAS